MKFAARNSASKVAEPPSASGEIDRKMSQEKGGASMNRKRFSRFTRLCAVAAVASLIGTGFTPGAANAQETEGPTELERVSAIVQPSIVYMETFWSGRVFQGLGGRRYYPFGKNRFFEIGPVRCSGFVVNPDGIIGTAGHCIQYEKDYGLAIARMARQKARRTGRFLYPFLALRVEGQRKSRLDREVNVAYGAAASGLRTGRFYPALPLKLRTFEKGDVALLRTEAEDLPALEMAPEAEIAIGTRVVAVGYPAAVDLVSDATFDPTFADGSVQRLGTVKQRLYQVYQIGAALSGGMSGGPTVDYQGRVIGINSFKINPLIETQQFNHISPAHLLSELMADRGVENEIGDVNETYREGLEAYWAGDKETALAKFDEVLGLVPSHELAQDFKGDTLRLADSVEAAPAGASSDDGSNSWWAWVALAVVAAGVGALVFVTRRRAAVATAPPPIAAAAPIAASPMAAPAAVQRRPQATVVGGLPSAGMALVISSGAQSGQRFEIGGTTLIGRENADIILEDAEVSRRHAFVRPTNGSLEIEDAGSTNGTQVNGARISGPTRLQTGDIVQLGETRMSVAGGRSQMTSFKTQPPVPVLVISAGNQVGRRMEVDRELLMGRDNADIDIDDPEVSRRHAIVRPAGGFAEIEDLGSSNGTFVNGHKIQSATGLREGDVIEIGGTKMEVASGRLRDTSSLRSEQTNHLR